jgi:hypothetical protein
MIVAECPNCHRLVITVQRRHMSTCYHDEASNYVTCCWECFLEIEEYWQERWADHWAGVMS